MDITLIVALVAAIAAIVAPSITAVINNRHALKMKRIEMTQKRRIEIIETYVESVSHYMVTKNIRNWDEFAAVSNEIFLYTSQEVWPQIKELNQLINNNSHENIEHQFSDLCESLAKHMVF